MPGYTITLTESERRLLFEIDREPRQSPDALAEIVGVEVHDVVQAIARLHHLGVIKYCMPIVNLELLGYSVYLCQGELRTANAGEGLAALRSHPNVGWLAVSSDRTRVIFAIFARSAMECRRFVEQIFLSEGVARQVLDISISDVYEKFILGQRYLVGDEQVVGYYFENSRITSGAADRIEIDKEQLATLASLREIQAASLPVVADALGKSVEQLQSVIGELEAAGLILRFQPVLDVSRLGMQWSFVSLRLRWMDTQEREAFLRYLWSKAKIVHINCMHGAWDYNFEVHWQRREEFDQLLVDVKRRLKSHLIELSEFTVGEELKFNFLVDGVLQQFAKGQGEPTDIEVTE